MGFGLVSCDPQGAEWSKYSFGGILDPSKIPLNLNTHLLAHTKHAVSAFTQHWVAQGGILYPVTHMELFIPNHFVLFLKLFHSLWFQRPFLNNWISLQSQSPPAPTPPPKKIVLGKSPQGIEALSFQTCFLLPSFFLLNKNCPGNQDSLRMVGEKIWLSLKEFMAYCLAGNLQGSFRRIL